jgi:hypothetical protein
MRFFSGASGRIVSHPAGSRGLGVLQCLQGVKTLVDLDDETILRAASTGLVWSILSVRYSERLDDDDIVASVGSKSDSSTTPWRRASTGSTSQVRSS